MTIESLADFLTKKTTKNQLKKHQKEEKNVKTL